MAQREYLRYSSVNSMEKAQKVNALKDLTLDPHLIQDPYDASANVLHRWKTIGSSPEAQSATPEQRSQVASNYFDKVIEPLYGEMHTKYGAPIPTKENWLENAYGAALKYDIDSAYDSHKWKGFYEGTKDFEQMFKTGATLLGGMLKIDKDLFSSSPGHPNYQQDLDSVKEKGFYKTVDQAAHTDPIAGATIDSLQHAISKDKFWTDINPSTSWGQKATSWAVENAMQLPLYTATGGYTRGVIAGALGGEARVPLTMLLSQSERGKTALKLLLNGAEGAMYCYTQADDADKPSQAMSGAIQLAIMGTIFHVKGEKLKLSDAVSPERAEELAENAEKAEMAKKGFVHGDSEALGKEVALSLRGVSLAGGRPLLSNTISKAFNHLAETEGMSPRAARAMIKMDYTNDPASFKSVYITAAWLRSELKGRLLSTLTPADREELTLKLKDRIRASDHLAAAEETETQEQIQKVAQTPTGQQVVKDVGPENYVKSNMAAAQKAAIETAKRPVDEALDIAKRRGEAALTLKTRTRGVGKSRYVSVSPSWEVYAKKQAKAAGFGFDVKKWLDNLPHDEFVKDLHDFFYPKSLTEAGLDDFESGHVANVGSENPNFLAFMYNFKDRMPQVFRDRLRNEFLDTDKVQRWLSGRALDEPQLERYAQGMRAHIDELLTTEKFKAENANVRGDYGNTYRSTYESPDSPTEYQLQLHVETIEKERELIQEMFKGRPQEARQALTTYNILASARAGAFGEGKQATRIQKQSEIDGLLVQLSKGKRVKWEY